MCIRHKELPSALRSVSIVYMFTAARGHGNYVNRGTEVQLIKQILVLFEALEITAFLLVSSYVRQTIEPVR